ncbi:MAG: arylesterase [Nitrospirae bacterium]|nr:arylesterase [Nitrospirota bacterium]
MRSLSWGILLLVLIGGSGCRQDSYDHSEGRSSRTAGSEETASSALRLSSPDHERVIVAFGDSLTAGLGVTSDEAYPAVLERKIHAAGFPYRVINAGVSGETTAGGLRRVPWILQNRPEVVILELGANDGLRGLSIVETKKNLADIIDALQKEHVRVVLAGMRMPPNYGKEYTEAFEKIFPELAKRYRLTLIPFFLEGVAGRSGLNQPDGIHPTAQGYQRIVDNLWPRLKPLLP